MGELESELKELASKDSQSVVVDLTEGAEEHDGVRVAVARVQVRDMERLVKLVDQVRDRLAPSVVALGGEADGKSLLAVSVTKGIDRVDAGALVKEASSVIGGGGGGSPSLGRGGGGDPTKLDEALSALRERVAGLLEA